MTVVLREGSIIHQGQCQVLDYNLQLEQRELLLQKYERTTISIEYTCRQH